jgi:regulator of sigma E protease
MISFLIFLFILSILIIVHESGHFFAAKSVGVKVEKFSLGFGPQLLKKKKNETEYSISAIPLGGYVKLAGDNLEEYKGLKFEYYSKSLSDRFKIVFSGPLLNYIMGFVCFWIVLVLGYPMLTTKVGGLIEGFGAQKAGLEAGDKILSVDGKKVDYWEDLQKVIQSKSASDKVKLLVLRENKELAVTVSIQEKQLDDQLGQKRNVGLLGITPFDQIVKVRYGPLESFKRSIEKTWELTVMTYKALWRMITGKLSIKESVAGPLGILYITSKAASFGVTAVIHLIAVLSVSLAIFNLLPFPVLDGGHILFLIIEKIRRKALSIKTERIVTQIGFSVILSIAILVTYNDILRLFGDKISKLIK